MTTHANRCELAARSLFRIAEAAEKYPGDGIEALRHLVVFKDGAPSPISSTTPTSLLKSPHPLAGAAPGTLVGVWTTEGWTHETARTRWESPNPGVLEWTTKPVEPLCIGPTRDKDDVLAADWYSRNYASHLDQDMPQADRESVARVLKTAGYVDTGFDEGEATCATTGRVRERSWRILPGDKLANTRELAWPPVALAAMVRDGGLRIDPAILRRMGIDPDGTRPAIVHSSHA